MVRRPACDWSLVPACCQQGSRRSCRYERTESRPRAPRVVRADLRTPPPSPSMPPQARWHPEDVARPFSCAGREENSLDEITSYQLAIPTAPVLYPDRYTLHCTRPGGTVHLRYTRVTQPTCPCPFYTYTQSALSQLTDVDHTPDTRVRVQAAPADSRHATDQTLALSHSRQCG